MSCPQSYHLNPDSEVCQHFTFPLSPTSIAGFIVTFLVAGFSSLAGVGGGTPHLVAVMILYNYTPKHSTIVIFCCILGTTLGNVLSQMRKKSICIRISSNHVYGFDHWGSAEQTSSEHWYLRVYHVLGSCFDKRHLQEVHCCLPKVNS